MLLPLLTALAAVTTAADDAAWWHQWLLPSTLDRVMQLGGLTLLAILFARGSILTKGQHDQRIADLKDYSAAERAAEDERHKREIQQMASHHLEMMSEKDVRFDGMKESRDVWRESSRHHEARADMATTQLLEANELAGLAIQQMEAVETAARTATTSSQTESGVT